MDELTGIQEDETELAHPINKYKFNNNERLPEKWSFKSVNIKKEKLIQAFNLLNQEENYVNNSAAAALAAALEDPYKIIKKR